MKWLRFFFVLALPFFTATDAQTTLRICTYNIGANFDENHGLGQPGQPDFDAVRDVLVRLNADVVCLQEVFSSDTRDSDGLTAPLDQLATQLGLPHIFVPGSELDSTLRVVFLSRHPFSLTDEIESPPGARDLTRAHPVVTVDVPDTDADPTFIGVHAKSGFPSTDRFRRAVDLLRIEKYLAAASLTDSDNVVILGDFNLIDSLSIETFTALPPQRMSGEDTPNTLPPSYVLGDDFERPINITYHPEPRPYFTTLDFDVVDALSPSSSDNTFGSSTLDYILVSQGLADLPIASEIYRSTQDSSTSGLPKPGTPLPSGTSSAASDHFPVVADITIEPDRPDLALTAISSSFDEGSTTPGALTVSIPAAVAADTTVTFSATGLTLDPVIIPAGQTSANLDLTIPANGIDDGNRALTIEADAAGFDRATLSITLIDIDPTVLAVTDPASFLIFDTFTGTADPATVTVQATDLQWRGVLAPGSGLFTAPGAPSFRLAESPITFTAAAQNATGRTLSSLDVAFTLTQLDNPANFATDTVAASLVIGTSTFPFPQSVETGSTSGSTRFSARYDNLALQPNAPLSLRITATPGAGATPPSEAVFLNELHYDNTGSDTGEFLEIIVGAGNTTPLDQIVVTLYNGSNGEPYDSFTLADFDVGDTITSASGTTLATLYSREIPGLQNGPAEGIAISTPAGLAQFLSYEGTLTATAGPASGITSVEIPIGQSPAAAAGSSSLILTGVGANPDDFSWSRPDSPFTRGSLNPGQTFAEPVARAAFSIDDVVIATDLDTDGDRITDYLEQTLTLTDPTDGNSTFSPSLAADGSTITFPSLPGRTYQLEASSNLISWTPVEGSVLVATGSHSSTFPLPASGGERQFYRIRIRLSQ